MQPEQQKPGQRFVLQQLWGLNLSKNHLEYDGARVLAGVLVQCPALTHLNLGDNNIGNAGAEAIGRVLGQCAALTHLNLNGNHIDTGVMRLAGQFSALSFLALDKNNLGNVKGFAASSAGALLIADSPQSRRD